MTNDEFRCDCVAMTRAIKDKIDAKFANMTGDEIIEYLDKSHLKFEEYVSSARLRRDSTLNKKTEKL